MADDAANASSNDDGTDADSNASSAPLVVAVPPLQYDDQGQAALEAAGDLDRRAYVDGQRNSTKPTRVLSDPVRLGGHAAVLAGNFRRVLRSRQPEPNVSGAPVVGASQSSATLSPVAAAPQATRVLPLQLTAPAPRAALAQPAVVILGSPRSSPAKRTRYGRWADPHELQRGVIDTILFCNAVHPMAQDASPTVRLVQTAHDGAPEVGGAASGRHDAVPRVLAGMAGLCSDPGGAGQQPPEPRRFLAGQQQRPRPAAGGGPRERR